MELTNDFKQRVLAEMALSRQMFGGSDASFAKRLGISGSQYSRVKNGIIEGQLSPANWITIARELGVSPRLDGWKAVRTAVYTDMEDNLRLCKEISKSMILVDDCGIGKTFCAKHIIKTLPNAFYLDCSQSTGKRAFVKMLAKTIGLEPQGKYDEILADIKYSLTALEKPIIVLDEAGDLDYNAFMVLKGIMNATENACAFYLMGAQGLKRKISRSLEQQKVGYAEMFSRLSDDFVSFIPQGDPRAKEEFLSQLISDVASGNLSDKNKIKPLVKKCMARCGTLRYVETLIKIDRQTA